MKNNTVTMVDISDILISKTFRNSPPRQEKINRSIEYYKKHGTLDEPLKLLDNNLLIDGYARYLAAKECGAKILPCIVSEPYRFIRAVHKPGGKVYTWKFKGMDIKTGDIVLARCFTYGKIKLRPVIVTEVFDNSEETDLLNTKSVVKVLQKGTEIC